jgi:hypothetical protein
VSVTLSSAGDYPPTFTSVFGAAPNSGGRKPSPSRLIELKILIFYQYVCNECGSCLLRSLSSVDPVRIRLSLNSTCPTCKANLLNNIGWCQVESDDPQFADLLTFEYSPPKLKFPVNFRKASELQVEPSLSFGDPKLDRFLGGLRLGHVAFLYGSWQCLAASLLLCVRTQLGPHYDGLDSKAIFIDGGNTFDPHLATEYAERFSLDQDLVLDHIFVSRAFTCHQLTSLIAQMLPEAVPKLGIKFIVASDMVKLYRDPDVRSDESLCLLKTALNSLVATARLERSIVLATSLNEKTSDSFLHVVKQRVNIVLRFEERGHSTRVVLEKHPTRSGERLLIKQPAPKVLEEFLESDTDG